MEIVKESFSTINGIVAIECEYSTRPGAKKEYKKTIFYKRAKTAKKKIDNYTGDLEISATYEDPVEKISGAIKSSWANTHSFSTETEEETKLESEMETQYYEGVTLLVRTLKFNYTVDGVSAKHIEEFTVLDVKGDTYTPAKCIREAKDYMKEMYGIEDKTNLRIPIQLKKKMYVKWKSCRTGDELPKDAVYAGDHNTDGGAVYVARINKTPGKVGLKDGKLLHFYARDFSSQNQGQMLLTNGKCKWVKINTCDVLPDNAFCSGVDHQGYTCYIGKSKHDEPGKIILYWDNGKKMCGDLWCHHHGKQTKDFEVLVIE